MINNTRDQTEDIVRLWQKKNKSLRYLNFVKGGKGFAVIEGFKDTLQRPNDLIGFVDADMSTPPEEYWKLIENIKNYDGIIADRYLKNSEVFPRPTIKRLMARKLFNFVIRSLLLLPFGDTQCGAKIFKREALERTLPYLSMSLWAFDVDLLYGFKIHNYKVKEIPTVWSDDVDSKLNVKKASLEMFFAIGRLRLMHSPFKFIVTLYNWITGKK